MDVSAVKARRGGPDIRVAFLIRPVVTLVVVGGLTLVFAPAAGGTRTTGPSGTRSGGCGAPTTAGTTDQVLGSGDAARPYRLAVAHHTRPSAT